MRRVGPPGFSRYPRPGKDRTLKDGDRPRHGLDWLRRTRRKPRSWCPARGLWRRQAWKQRGRKRAWKVHTPSARWWGGTGPPLTDGEAISARLGSRGVGDFNCAPSPRDRCQLAGAGGGATTRKPEAWTSGSRARLFPSPPLCLWGSQRGSGRVAIKRRTDDQVEQP